LSNGRVIITIGVGSLKEEFDLLGRPFEDRGERADDAIRALRASLSTRTPSYHGAFHAYEGWILEPHAVQERVPIWIAGRTLRSLRRATELGDGWCPFGMTLDELVPLLDKRRTEIEERGDGFDLVLAPEPPLDPSGHPDEATDAVRAYEAAGATKLNLRFRHESLQHYLDQLEAMAKLSS
jgi:alkanesulfonate monooxygenase SsuD/methylene tetrahydromethanopterin reductase-like flavin-dependent oxidoreductase (luciferase family)